MVTQPTSGLPVIAAATRNFGVPVLIPMGMSPAPDADAPVHYVSQAAPDLSGARARIPHLAPTRNDENVRQLQRHPRHP